jgi:glycosyltransferase involved in cell wall biosynthesis
MLDCLRSEIATGSVRFVHFNHIDAAQYVEHLPKLAPDVRSVFDTHNVLTTTYERLVDTAANPLRRAYCWVQWSKMHRYEPAVMKRVDRVLACSEVEREWMHTRGVNRAMLVPNGVDTERFAPRANGRPASDACRIVFTGGMDYFPNEDGIRWFLTSVVPELEKVLPTFQLTIVGKNPPPKLAALARPGRIEFTGRVDDVRPYTAAADVFVVPLRIGGGTRLKILEAMSMSIPVVSTRVGAEGIGVSEGRDILLADEPSEMANAIASLARSPERRRALAESGRALVLERYDWKRVTAGLVAYYRGG